jgi:hypothetical protein
MLIAALLLGSLTVALTYTPLSSNETPTRAGFQQALHDTLTHMATAPDPTRAYPTLLDRAIAEALQGDTSYLDSRLVKALPPGAQWNAWLDNGHGRLQLKWTRENAGESVSSDRLFVPQWDPVIALPMARELDASRSSLVVQAVPVHRALGLQSEPGFAAEVQVRLPGGAMRNLTTFAPMANTTDGGPAAVLSVLSAGTRTLLAQPDDGNHSLWFSVEEALGRAIPAGTTMSVRVPSNFTAVQGDAAVNPDWTNLRVEGNATYGWTVRADLAADLASDQRLLRVNMTPPTWGKLHLLTADLDGGNLGRLYAMYVSPSGSTPSGMLPPGRGPWLTLPDDAPYDGEARGGLVLAYPDSASRTLTVTRVTLRAVGGASLLGATGLSPGSGWTVSGDQLEWAGSLDLANDGAQEFLFQMRAGAPARPANAGLQGLGLDLEDGLTRSAPWQSQAGLFVDRVAARNASAQGFVETAGTNEARLNGTHDGGSLSGKLAYDTVSNTVVQAAASDLARGLAESWVSTTAPSAPLGGTVSWDWDLSRVVEELGVQALGFKCYTGTGGDSQGVATESDCVPPGPGLAWQFRHEAPTVSLHILHPSPPGAGGPAEAAVLTGLAEQGTATWTVPDGSLLGTHPFELRAEFRAHDDAKQLTQRVSLLGSFDVVPLSGTGGTAPAYWLLVQAWLPDWG